MSKKTRYVRFKYAGTSAKPKLVGAEHRIELKFHCQSKNTILHVELDTWQWRELADQVERVGKDIAKELQQRANRVVYDTRRMDPQF